VKLVEQFFDGAVKVIEPTLFKDNRGFFFENYSFKKLEELGITANFIQDNHSYSSEKYTIRGLHFQRGDMAQAKLVRVVMGSAIDYIVDMRDESKTFGQHVAIEINETNNYQIFIPRGFAHGFCTLTSDCHFLYKVDNYYSAEHNAGVIWNDPTVAIKWPISTPVLSEQDKKWPTLKEYIEKRN
jgi:dTDP-4-dehydrorhamnose 3,5-epimerase